MLHQYRCPDTSSCDSTFISIDGSQPDNFALFSRLLLDAAVNKSKIGYRSRKLQPVFSTLWTPCVANNMVSELKFGNRDGTRSCRTKIKLVLSNSSMKPKLNSTLLFHFATKIAVTFPSNTSPINSSVSLTLCWKIIGSLLSFSRVLVFLVPSYSF